MNYVLYYGQGEVQKLADYDLVIVQEETLTHHDLESLKSHHVPVIVYLSLGEVEAHRPWFNAPSFEQNWILAKNAVWQSYYVDVSAQGWQNIILDVIEGYIWAGYSGVFLDTIDAVDVFAHLKQPMTHLIQRIRSRYPDLILIQNRGFSILCDVAQDLDAIVYEAMLTTYNFEHKQYEVRQGEPFYLPVFQAIDQRHSLLRLSLDYVNFENLVLAKQIILKARRMGFIPTISQIYLNSIPPKSWFEVS